MRLYKGLMIVTDLDGTILGKNMFSDIDQKAKEHFEDNGGIFTIATGRSLTSAKSVLNNIKIKVPAILNNGPLIQHIDTGKIYNVTYLPKETKYILKEILEKYPRLAAEIFCDDKMYLVKSNETSDIHVKNEAMNFVITDIDNVPDNWIKVVLLDEPNKLASAATELKNQDFPFKQIWSYGSIFLELINENSDKGASVLELAKSLGIAREKIICVGDAVNDIGMIKAAGCGLAVSNAADEVKNIADKIIVSKDENPLDYIVRNIDEFIL